MMLTSYFFFINHFFSTALGAYQQAELAVTAAAGEAAEEYKMLALLVRSRERWRRRELSASSSNVKRLHHQYSTSVASTAEAVKREALAEKQLAIVDESGREEVSRLTAEADAADTAHKSKS